MPHDSTLVLCERIHAGERNSGCPGNLHVTENHDTVIETDAALAQERGDLGGPALLFIVFLRPQACGILVPTGDDHEFGLEMLRGLLQ